MKYKIILLALGFLFVNGLSAQISRSELETQTSKGLTLMKNGKLDDAVAIFNKILTKDPTEGKALLLRARAKYELSAFKGAKKDCFSYLDIYGIDDEVAGLLGKTEKALENYKQALAYLKVALMFNPDGLEYLMDRAEIYYNLGLDEQACVDWHQAMLNGSSEARQKSSRHCKRVRIPIDEITKEEVEEVEEPAREEEEDVVDEEEETEYVDEDYSNDEEEVVDEEAGENPPKREDVPVVFEDEDEDEEEEEPEEERYPIDNSVEELFIDEELTIMIGDGIGSRKVINMPDILILSDKSGKVVVNVCVDRLGRVVDPTLNEKFSTLKTSSLVSLALRESSNFRFARSTRKDHCGTITFVITGSE